LGGYADLTTELVKNEADVVRLFHKHVSGVVISHFTSIPLGTTSFRGSIDTEFFQVPTQGLLTIGEHKALGVIASESSPTLQTSKTQRLGSELRV
jgi:hypothetical protein